MVVFSTAAHAISGSTLLEAAPADFFIDMSFAESDGGLAEAITMSSSTLRGRRFSGGLG